MIFRNSPMIFTINTNSKIEAIITFLTYKSSNIELNDSLYYTMQLITIRNSMPMDMSCTVTYYTHLSLLTLTNLLFKDIDDSLYWDYTLIKYRHSLPMGISRTEMYYTHQPILNPYSSNKSCKWSSFWLKLLMKTTTIWDNDRYWLPQ